LIIAKELLAGTLLVAIGGAVIALPVGLLTAIFLSEYAPGWLRDIIKPVLEVLAGIPTVVLGFFALNFVSRDVIQVLFPGTQIFNAASAAIVVGIMIIPLVSSLSEDAIASWASEMRPGQQSLEETARWWYRLLRHPHPSSAISRLSADVDRRWRWALPRTSPGIRWRVARQ
jgi:ABC-type phosphate transport system permease subunit